MNFNSQVKLQCTVPQLFYSLSHAICRSSNIWSNGAGLCCPENRVDIVVLLLAQSGAGQQLWGRKWTRSSRRRGITGNAEWQFMVWLLDRHSLVSSRVTGGRRRLVCLSSRHGISVAYMSGEGWHAKRFEVNGDPDNTLCCCCRLQLLFGCWMTWLLICEGSCG